jgi:hypothetical protein
MPGLKVPAELEVILQEVLTEDQLARVARNRYVSLYPEHLVRIFEAGRETEARRIAAALPEGSKILVIPPSDHDEVETNLEMAIRERYEKHAENPPLRGVDAQLAWDYYKSAWEDCITTYEQTNSASTAAG